MVHTVQSHVSFNCIDFLCLWHWFLIDVNALRNYAFILDSIHKFIICMFGATERICLKLCLLLLCDVPNAMGEPTSIY